MTGQALWAQPVVQMPLMPMASVMAVAEPKWVSVWGRFLWLALLSMALGSLLALLLPLGAVEEQYLAVLRGFHLLRSKLDRATKGTSPSTELSVTSGDVGLLTAKTKASPGERAGRQLGWVFTVGLQCPMCRPEGAMANEAVQNLSLASD